MGPSPRRTTGFTDLRGLTTPTKDLGGEQAPGRACRAHCKHPSYGYSCERSNIVPATLKLSILPKASYPKCPHLETRRLKVENTETKTRKELSRRRDGGSPRSGASLRPLQLEHGKGREGHTEPVREAAADSASCCQPRPKRGLAARNGPRRWHAQMRKSVCTPAVTLPSTGRGWTAILPKGSYSTCRQPPLLSPEACSGSESLKTSGSRTLSVRGSARSFFNTMLPGPASHISSWPGEIVAAAALPFLSPAESRSTRRPETSRWSRKASG